MKKEIIIFALIIGLSILGFGFFIYRGKIEELNYRAKEKAASIFLRDDCLKQMHRNYAIKWNANCEMLGREKNCYLPLNIAREVEKIYKEERDDCFKRF